MEDPEQKKPDAALPPLLTAREVAAGLRLSVKTVCHLAATGALPGIKIGRDWRFQWAEVQERIATAKRRERDQPA